MFEFFIKNRIKCLSWRIYTSIEQTLLHLMDKMESL
jgi:hypothetical protein